MSYTEKLAAMGYELESIDLDAGRFVHAVHTGNLIFTAGQVSRWGDREVKGKLGQDLTVEQGYEAARMCTLNCLQAIHAAAGSIDKVTRVVKVLGMVNVGPGFNDTPGVIHGCSDLLNEVFGETGRHAAQRGRYDHSLRLCSRGRDGGRGAGLSRTFWSHLESRLETAVADYPGIAGLCLHDLTSGVTVGINADEEFPAASTIKIHILTCLFAQAERRRNRSRRRCAHRSARRRRR